MRIKKRNTTNTTDSVTTNEVNPKQNRLVVAIINGVQNELKKQPQSTQMIRYPSNGSQIIVAANVTNSNNYSGKNASKIITYDHLGNPL